VQLGKHRRHMRQVLRRNKMKTPKLDIEFGWSVFKGMFLLLIFTNLLWAGIHFTYVYKSFNGTAMEVMQDGTNNNQSVKNG